MKTIELSIKEFAVNILRKWPIVLAFVLVFAVLLGVLGEGPHHQQVQNKQTEYTAALEEYETAITKYENAMKDYMKAVETQKIDFEKALEEYNNAPKLNAIKLSELKKERDAVKSFLENSFLMNIDPDNKQVATISIQMSGDAGNSLNSTTTRQISERYFTLAEDAPIKLLFNSFSQNEYDEKYLREMYKVSKGTFDIIRIAVFGNKDIDADKCVQAVYDYLLSKQEAVTEGSGIKHSISILSRSDSREIDASLKTLQVKQRQQLNTLESEIEILEAIVLKKPVEPEALQPPTKPEPPEAPINSVYNFFSQALYGIAIGIVISVIVLSLFYVLRLPVQLPEQIQRQLAIRYHGGIKKRGKVLNPGTKLAGSLRLLDEGKAVGLIAANINEVLGAHRKILVTGSAPEGAVKAFIKSIEKALNRDGVSFDYAKDVNADAEAVSMLSNADAVLLVERLNHSKLRKVNYTKERIEMSGKEILGYVLV